MIACRALSAGLALALFAAPAGAGAYEREWGASVELAPTYRYFGSSKLLPEISQHGVGATTLVGLRYEPVDDLTIQARVQGASYALFASDTLPADRRSAIGGTLGIGYGLRFARHWRLEGATAVGANRMVVPLLDATGGTAAPERRTYFVWLFEGSIGCALARDVELAVTARLSLGFTSEFAEIGAMTGLRFTYVFGG